MPRRLPRIAHFPTGLWHANLLGAITRNPTSPTESNIRVHLGQLQVPSEHIKYPNAIDSKMNRVTEVTIGSLPLVHAGSIWKDGRLIEPTKNGYGCETFNLNIADSNTRIIKLGDLLSAQGHQSVSLPLKVLFAPTTDPAALDEWCETRWLAVDTGKAASDQNKLLIPITELVRFYYFSSTAFAQALFSQGFEELLDFYTRPTKNINSRRMFIMSSLPTGFMVNDLWTFARLVLHGAARRYAINVWKDLAAQSASHNYSGLSFLGANREIKFPFTGKTTLSAYGRWVRNEKKTWHFLVMWLSSCTYPMPYDDIMLEGEGHIRVAWQRPDEEAQEGLAGSRSVNRFPRDGAVQGDLREDLKARAGTTGLILPVHQNRFSNLNGKSILTQGPDSTIRLLGTFHQAGGIGRDLSTSMDTQGNAIRTRFTVDFNGTKFTSDFTDETLDELDELADELVKQTRDTNLLKYVYLSLNQLDPLVTTSHFLPNTDLTKPARGWLSMRDDKNTHRQAAIVEFTGHPKGAYYLFEIQRNNDKEHHALVMGYATKGTKLSRQTLEAALAICCARSGVWPYADEIPNLETVRFPHAFEDISGFASEIIRTMDNPSLREHTKKRRKTRQ